MFLNFNIEERVHFIDKNLNDSNKMGIVEAVPIIIHGGAADHTTPRGGLPA